MSEEPVSTTAWSEPGAETPASSGAAPVSEPVERIMDAAEQCFRELGYDGSAVRTIANTAGVSKSLVLYHFHSKEQLYADVQTRLYDQLARSIRASVAVRGGTVTERGLLALDALFEVLRQHNDLPMHALMGARALSNGKLRHQVDRLRNDLRRLLRDTMHAVIGDAQLPMSLDAATDLLWASLIGIGLESALDEELDRTERTLAAVRTLVETGLRSAEDSPEAGDADQGVQNLESPGGRA